jgi:hypothetical protein
MSYGEYRISYGEYQIAYGENRNSYGENHVALWRKLFWYGENYLESDFEWRALALYGDSCFFR